MSYRFIFHPVRAVPLLLRKVRQIDYCAPAPAPAPTPAPGQVNGIRKCHRFNSSIALAYFLLGSR